MLWRLGNADVLSAFSFPMTNMTQTRWPARLWLVRHGQSAGNVARDLAHDEGAHRIQLDLRDVDIPLSALGEQQAAALGQWFAAGKGNGRPEVILSSTYLRAQQTARIFRDAGGADPDEAICSDERLAALDRRMAAQFDDAIANADRATRRIIRRSREPFLAWRDECPDAACVADAYRDRIAELRDYPVDERR